MSEFTIVTQGHFFEIPIVLTVDDPFMAGNGTIKAVLWPERHLHFGKPPLRFTRPAAPDRPPHYRTWFYEWHQLCATSFARHVFRIEGVNLIEIERITAVALADKETDHSARSDTPHFVDDDTYWTGRLATRH